MIKKIELNNVVPYVNGFVLDNLHKINYIYGANASGKTTLSHFLEQTDDEKYTDCSIEWENGIKVETYVYNRFFREKNFGNSPIPGVFTLGQATKEEKETINKKNEDLEKIKQDGIAKKKAKENLQKQKDDAISLFRENVWKTIYKKYEDVFSDKSKERFGNMLCHEYSNNKSELKSYEDLKAKAEVVFKKNPISLEPISSIEIDGILAIEENSIWQKKIIGKNDVDISKLINRLNISDWVHEGVKHIEKDSKVCPFCQRETIDDNFRSQIEMFFDEDYIKDTASIKSLSDKYYQELNNIISLLQATQNKEKQNTETKLNLEVFSAYLDTLKTQLESNNDLISSKIKEPSRSIELKSSKEQFNKIAELINQANQEIKKHNDLVSNLGKEKENLKHKIWKFLVEDNKTIIQNFIKKDNGLQRGIDNLEQKRTKLLIQYQNLDADITFASKTNDIVENLKNILDEIEKRKEHYSNEMKDIYIFIYAMELGQPFKATKGNYGFEQSEAMQTLSDILRDGSLMHVHTILQIDNHYNLYHTADNILLYFNHRIALQMTSSDSNRLIECDAASNLEVDGEEWTKYRGYYFNQSKNSLTKFRPYNSQI